MKKICEYCEKEFDTVKDKQRFCSKKCHGDSIKETKILRECEMIGCNNTFYVYPHSKTPQRLCSRKCQVEWQKINMVGENNPNFGNRKPGMFKHSEEAKKTIKKKVTESWKSEDRLIKHLLFFERHRLSDGSMDWHTLEYRDNVSQSNIKRLLNNEENYSYKNCSKGYYLNNKTNENERYHSSWELNRMIELNNDKTIKLWTKKHEIVIKYFQNGVTKRYLPDFYIEYFDGKLRIEEIKGYVEDEEQLKLKIIAAKEYCKKKNIEFVINYVDNEKKYKHLIEWEKKLN
jgi:hypothetical protein